MLKRQYRLPASIRFRHASFFRTPFFSVKIVPNNLSHSRFGFIVRKSVDKRATVRNRIRRLFRSCVEDMCESMQDSYDMLFFLEKGIIGRRRESVCQEINSLFTEQKLLK